MLLYEFDEWISRNLWTREKLNERSLSLSLFSVRRRKSPNEADVDLRQRLDLKTESLSTEQCYKNGNGPTYNNINRFNYCNYNYCVHFAHFLTCIEKHMGNNLKTLHSREGSNGWADLSYFLDGKNKKSASCMSQYVCLVSRNNSLQFPASLYYILPAHARILMPKRILMVWEWARLGKEGGNVVDLFKNGRIKGSRVKRRRKTNHGGANRRGAT